MGIAKTAKTSTLSLDFTQELTGCHHRQKDFELGAWLDGEPMGYVNFSIFENRLNVHYVFVRPDFRRRGIATAMYRQLAKEHPGQAIQSHGNVITDDGWAFRTAFAAGPANSPISSIR